MLRVKAGVADNGFAAAQVSGTLALAEDGCLLIDDVLLVLPRDATTSNNDVTVGGKTFSPGDTLTGAGGFFGPDAVAQMTDADALAAWQACGAPQQTAVIADPSTIS